MPKGKSAPKSTATKVATQVKKSVKDKVIPKLAQKAQATQKTQAEKVVETTKTAAKSRKMTEAQLQELRMTAKWAQLQSKMGTEKPPVYSMRNEYLAQTAIEHKQLGWGFILENKNDRLEVLFQDGIRYLISNYK